MKTTFGAALVAASAALALVVSGCSSDEAGSASRAEIKTLRIGTIGSGNTLSGPLGFAQSQNKLVPALADLGVENVEIFSFPNGPDLNQALVAGELDVANYGDTPALVAKGSGLDTRLLAVTAFDNNAGVVAKDPAITSLRDLSGKKIGVPSGSYIDRYLQGALQEEGITAELIHLYPADQEAPLNSGEIDAAALPDVNPSASLHAFLAKGFHQVDSVYDNHRDLAGTSASVSSEEFLDTNPEFGAAWQQLLSSSATYAKQHWDDYLAYEIGQSNFPPDVVRGAANPDSIAEEPFPAKAVELLTGTKQFLVDKGNIREDFDLNEWFYEPGSAGEE
ncbi:NrtA/SsuA/CpmA family ABC transporter substrate-binding protein [Rhodococcus sp. Eu-32]|uniref:ABC transporter substrate-binding protein n=1 Tax=Rhodococcus sp. Eu-32 TaxID=1017319 RepID=UPI001A9DA409|nr:NrtA/SsuA/CpmA family ABC transporter substrate-binding protein [Rhodococcus sp. Eu-32]